MENKTLQYDWVSKIFHWASAFFILPATAIGIWWIWVDLDTDSGWEQFEKLIEWHANLGLAVILIMLHRLLWRLRSKVPAAPYKTALNRTLVLYAHRILYALAILTPVSGWLGSSLDGATFHFFFLLFIPPIFGVHPSIASVLTQVHIYASWMFIFFIVLHIAAVLVHQFWLKDKLVSRML